MKRTSSVASPDPDVLKVALANKRRKVNDVEKIDAPVMGKYFTNLELTLPLPHSNHNIYINIQFHNSSWK